jgi:hypothetical protein
LTKRRGESKGDKVVLSINQAVIAMTITKEKKRLVAEFVFFFIPFCFCVCVRVCVCVTVLCMNEVEVSNDKLSHPF